MTTSEPAGSPTAAQLRALLEEVMVRDRARLRGRIDRARNDHALLREAAAEVDAAIGRVGTRRSRLPQPTYPDLPITARRAELLRVISDHQVVVVAGETGSGKSTQLPKLCLELGRGVLGLVGHTQPRRLAARTVAERIAEELNTTVGGVVGYTVRFTDRVADGTYVKVMTDGILLAELQRDRMLSRYDTLIIDEAHERSLNIDFILGYIKQLLPRRPDLKVIITSATIDTERFSRHFGDAPVVEVSGRSHPVTVRYRPFGVDPGDDRDQTQAIIDAVDELRSEPPGDVLVFLSGEREIRDTADALDKLAMPGTEILPLYARLSAAEQHRVFHDHPGRRIVLATNVAETSLTVPGVRYVVDPGTARISRYSRRTKVQRLPIEAVSQASANQRAGRCGRVAPGVCIRLYGEDDFASRPAFTDPEILRTNLASVILQMSAIGLGDVEAFPFVDPPDRRAVKDGVALLEELGALDPDEPDVRKRLTPLGRRLAQLPLDPRLGRMVLDADRNGCVNEVLVVASALSIQDPRERPLDKQEVAAASHARFDDPGSDFVAFLNLWSYLQEQQEELSSNQFRRLCRTEFFNYLRVREWQDIHGQLRVVARSIGVRGGGPAASHDSLHRALLAGLLTNIGVRDGDTREFLGPRGARFLIGRGSVLARKPPRWVMAAELVETNRLWARTTARIRPEWVERLAGHLVHRTYSEPRWDNTHANVVADERVTLHGLTIVARRTVPYGRVDRDAARRLFIQHALVERDWETHHQFLPANDAVLAEAEAQAARARRRDLVVGDQTLFAFYDDRIPVDITSGRQFDSWWKRAAPKHPDALTMTMADLFPADAMALDAEAFPTVWRQGDLELEVVYEFDPTTDTDGATVVIPLAVLNRVRPDGFDWHVPGLRHELVTELIRTLPKPVRRSFVPAPDVAAAFLAETTPADGPLVDVLTRVLPRQAGDAIPPGSFDPDRLPAHLLVTFRAVDDQGEELARSTDLVALQEALTAEVRGAIAAVAGEPGGGTAVEHVGATTWTFGPVARLIEGWRGGQRVVAHPSLVDEGDSVSLRMLPTADEQAEAMWSGTRRLLLLNVPSPHRAIGRILDEQAKLAVGHAPHASRAELLEDCSACAVDHVLDAAGGPVWDAEAFDHLRRRVRDDLPAVASRVATMVAGILTRALSIDWTLRQAEVGVRKPAVDDMRLQLAQLLHPGFVAGAGLDRLADIQRYLDAMERRLERLGDVARDRGLMQRVQRIEDRYERLLDTVAPASVDDDLLEVAWLLQELRVSLFAQGLGTARPVSETRITKILDRFGAGRG